MDQALKLGQKENQNFSLVLVREREREIAGDGLRMGDLRGDSGDVISVSVSQSEALQGVRREASLGSNHFQHQPLTARSLRYHPCFISRGKDGKLEGGSLFLPLQGKDTVVEDVRVEEDTVVVKEEVTEEAVEEDGNSFI
ncbi:PREDICTED: uncharacterized protein LOC109126644 [Camelina sativa]|uniref:Uncharacterized protein LOC109126644 n=1 Tax=Camelina sativa TaxID=90675 RepID=A0ABM1QGQ1_CAMSA|nr:PREDICTED: uncharacterized protein LOC109126644 [Camelina sativa]